MEKTVVLKAELREHSGSVDAARVRRDGRIPAIVYGHKQEPTAVSLDAHSLLEELHHGHRLMDVQIGKNQEKMIIKDIQYDYLGRNVIHLDLMRVDVTETVRVTIPIELKGTAKGATGGGVIEKHTDHIEVECKVTDIPHSVVVLIKDIDIGDSIHAGDVTLPQGVKLISPSDMVLVTCGLVATAKTTEELEAEVKK
jgi:large subunit ribosomal protein L25